MWCRLYNRPTLQPTSLHQSRLATGAPRRRCAAPTAAAAAAAAAAGAGAAAAAAARRPPLPSQPPYPAAAAAAGEYSTSSRLPDAPPCEDDSSTRDTAAARRQRRKARRLEDGDSGALADCVALAARNHRPHRGAALVSLYARLRERCRGEDDIVYSSSSSGNGRHQNQQQQQEENENVAASGNSSTDEPPPPTPPTFDEAWRALVDATLASRARMAPDHWAQALYSAAKLRHADGELIAAAVDGTAGRLAALSEAGLANLLWALAVVGARPPPEWLDDAAAAAAAAAASTGELAGGGASTSYTSSSSSSSREAAPTPMPPPPPLNPWDRPKRLNPHQLSQSLFALARLGHRPPAPVVAALLAALKPRLGRLSAGELGTVAWALARLRFRPDRPWLRAYARASETSLTVRAVASSAGEGGRNGGGVRYTPAARAPHVAAMLAGLSRLRALPAAPRWHSALRGALRALCPSMRPRELAGVASALASARAPLPPYWLGLLAARAAELLAAADASGAGGSRPSSSGRRRAEPFPDDALAAIVWALPRLAHPRARAFASEHAPLLAAAARASAPRLAAMRPAQLVQLAAGFSALGFRPGLQWIKSHENAVAARWAEMDAANRARLRAAARRWWVE